MDMGSFAELMEDVLPAGWELEQPDMGMESLLVAPDGCVTELDGECPHGNVSPLIAAGLV